MKLISATILLLATTLACNDAAMQAGKNPRVTDSGDDDDSAAEPVMVAGAYLTCWPHKTSGAKADGSEDIGCRLEDQSSGDKLDIDPTKIDWRIENANLRLVENDVRICARTDDCHAIIYNVFDRSSKQVVANVDANTLSRGLSELSVPPTERLNLRLVGHIDGYQTKDDLKDQKNKNLAVGGFLAMIGLVSGDPASMGNGIVNMIAASELKGTDVEAVCNNSLSVGQNLMTSPSSGASGDAHSMLLNRQVCIADPKIAMNAAKNCFIIGIKGRNGVQQNGIFKGLNTDGNLYNRISQELLSNPTFRCN